MFASCNVIEEHHLCVLFSRNLDTFGAVTWRVFVRVNVDHLTIAFVPEQQTSVGIGVNSEVRGII